MAIHREMSLMSWQETIREQYDTQSITFRNNDSNMMAFMSLNLNTSVLVGRYDKFSHKGRIFDNETTNFKPKLS